MKRVLFGASVLVLALAASYVTASAAGQKLVRGTITAIAPNSLSIAAGSQAMTFAVDGQTHVEAPGAGTKARAAQAAGKPGATLGDVIRTGQSVEVSYEEADGAMRAIGVRRIASVASTDPAAWSEARGTVTAISRSSMTIAGSSGPATFTQTYVIDSHTSVTGKGVGTAMSAKGGRAPIDDVVSVGDAVSVSYHAGADAPHAGAVRVLQSSSSSK